MTTAGLSVRTATRADEAGIVALIGRDQIALHKRFGQFSVPHLLETCVRCVVVIDERERDRAAAVVPGGAAAATTATAPIVGFAAFLDAPPPGLPYKEFGPAVWLQYLKATFPSAPYTAANSLWLSFFVAHAMREAPIAQLLLRHVFMSLPSLDGVLALVPLAVPVFAPLRDVFAPLTPKHAEYSGPKVWGVGRARFVSHLTIRKARIEDHDDLVPVFNAQSEVLTSIYGEFFLAELIESQNAHNHALVAELSAADVAAQQAAAAAAAAGVAAPTAAPVPSHLTAPKAVGLMAITDECDLRLLRDCFALGAYDLLRKRTLKEEKVAVTKATEVVKQTTADPKLMAEKLQQTFDVFKQKEDERADASDDDTVPLIQKNTVRGVLDRYVESTRVAEQETKQTQLKPIDITADCYVTASSNQERVPFLTDRTKHTFWTDDTTLRSGMGLLDADGRPLTAAAAGSGAASRAKSRSEFPDADEDDDKSDGEGGSGNGEGKSRPVIDPATAPPFVPQWIRVSFDKPMSVQSVHLYLDGKRERGNLKDVALYVGDDPAHLTKVFTTRLDRAHSGWCAFPMSACTLAPGVVTPVPEAGGAAITARCFQFELLSVHRARKSAPHVHVNQIAVFAPDRKLSVIAESAFKDFDSLEVKSFNKSTFQEHMTEFASKLPSQYRLAFCEFLEEQAAALQLARLDDDDGPLRSDLDSDDDLKSEGGGGGGGGGSGAVDSGGASGGVDRAAGRRASAKLLDGNAGAAAAATAAAAAAGTAPSGSGAAPAGAASASGSAPPPAGDAGAAGPRSGSQPGTADAKADDSSTGGDRGDGAVDTPADEDEDENGEPNFAANNAFCVTMFCLDSKFDSRAGDFLCEAFKLFPDKDYCLLTLPHTADEPSVLAHHFTRVPPLPHNSFSHVLYLVHRASVPPPSVNPNAVKAAAATAAAAAAAAAQAAAAVDTKTPSAGAGGFQISVSPAGGGAAAPAAGGVSITLTPATGTPEPNAVAAAAGPSSANPSGGSSNSSAYLSLAVRYASAEYVAPVRRLIEAGLAVSSGTSSSSSSSAAANSRVAEQMIGAMEKSLKAMAEHEAQSKAKRGKAGSAFLSGLGHETLLDEELRKIPSAPPAAVFVVTAESPNAAERAAALASGNPAAAEKVVGVVMCEELDDVGQLRAEFAVEDFVVFKHQFMNAYPATRKMPSMNARVTWFVLNPLFKARANFVFREVLRLYAKHALYYEVKDATTAVGGDADAQQQQQPQKPLQDVLGQFVQVRPRRRPVQPTSLLAAQQVARTQAALQEAEERKVRDTEAGYAMNSARTPGGTTPSPIPGQSQATAAEAKVQSAAASNGSNSGQPAPALHALHMVTRPLLSTPKTTVNARIVVVGASDVSLSFLETLLLVPTLHFTHLTLVSRHGLPLNDVCRSIREPSSDGTSSGTAGGPNFLPWSVCYDSNAMARLSFRSRVRVVADALHSLDTEQRTVTTVSAANAAAAAAAAAATSDDPASGAASTSAAAVVPYDILVLAPGLQDQLMSTATRVLESPVGGVFAMDSEHDLSAFVSWQAAHKPRTVLVFGLSLQALCTIRGLLDVGVPAASIVWAHPYAAGSTGAASWCHYDSLVATRVYDAVEAEGVRIIPEVRLVGVKVVSDEHDADLTHTLTHVCLQKTSSNPKSGPEPEQKLWTSDQWDDVVLLPKPGAPTPPPGSSAAVPSLRQSADADVTSFLVAADALIGCDSVNSSVAASGGSLTGSGSSSSSGSGSAAAHSSDASSWRDVDRSIFVAATRHNHLVYDGRMVVDHAFRTADANVYAAGPFAKFSRKYGRTLPLQEFDSREVGRRVAESVLKSLDPAGVHQTHNTYASVSVYAKSSTDANANAGANGGLAMSISLNGGDAKHHVVQTPVKGAADDNNNNNSSGSASGGSSAQSALPVLGDTPKSEVGVLPGGYEYFHAHKPSLVAIRKPKVLVTDNKAGQIVRLVFDEYDILRSITFVGRQYNPNAANNSNSAGGKPSSSSSQAAVTPAERHVQVTNLVHLIGLPAAYMNRILVRYAQSEITDLLAFLQSAWATALYHEQFAALRQALHANLSAQARSSSGGATELHERLTRLASIRADEHSDPRDLLLISDPLPVTVKEHVRRELLTFLVSHANHLPGFILADDTPWQPAAGNAALAMARATAATARPNQIAAAASAAAR